MATRELTEGTFEQTVASDGIRSTPTRMAFRDGVLVFSQPGALSAPALDHVNAGIGGLDMDDVRARDAAANAGSAGVGSA